MTNQGDYNTKLKAMLGDRDTYQPLTKDPTTSLENKMNRILMKLRQEGHLSKGTYHQLRSRQGSTPVWVTQKAGHPTQANCLIPVITHIWTIEVPGIPAETCGGSLCSHVRNSQHSAQFIRSQRLKDEEVVVSFDVVSLFTHPTDLALQASRKQLESDPSLPHRTGLSVDDICSLLNLCLEATYLMFEGKIYQQVHGTAMGSPVSMVVMNLAMENIVCRALSSFHTPLRFWRRYVDDTCTVLPRDLVESFHTHLNSIDPNIQFTVERESEWQLPFLDVLLTREDDGGGISTSVFRKATHMDQYLAYESHHPTTHKKAVIRTLMCRAETFSFTGVSQAQKEECVQQSLQKNGYRIAFITRPSLSQPVPRNEEQTPWTSVSILYIHGLSQSICRLLSPLAIKVTFRPF